MCGRPLSYCNTGILGNLDNYGNTTCRGGNLPLMHHCVAFRLDCPFGEIISTLFVPQHQSVGLDWVIRTAFGMISRRRFASAWVWRLTLAWLLPLASCCSSTLSPKVVLHSPSKGSDPHETNVAFFLIRLYCPPLLFGNTHVNGQPSSCLRPSSCAGHNSLTLFNR